MIYILKCCVSSLKEKEESEECFMY